MKKFPQFYMLKSNTSPLLEGGLGIAIEPMVTLEVLWRDCFGGKAGCISPTSENRSPRSIKQAQKCIVRLGTKKYNLKASFRTNSMKLCVKEGKGLPWQRFLEPILKQRWYRIIHWIELGKTVTFTLWCFKFSSLILIFEERPTNIFAQNFEITLIWARKIATIFDWGCWFVLFQKNWNRDEILQHCHLDVTVVLDSIQAFWD